MNFEDKYLKKLERSWMRWKDKGRQVPLKAEPEEGYYHSTLKPLYFILIFFHFIYFL